MEEQRFYHLLDTTSLAGTRPRMFDYKASEPLALRYTELRMDGCDPVEMSALRELIAHQYSRIIHSKAFNRAKNSVAEVQDLEQDGYLGLGIALEGFNPKKGKFHSYALKIVETQIIADLIDMRRTTLVPKRAYSIRKIADELSQTYGRDATPEEVHAHIRILGRNWYPSLRAVRDSMRVAPDLTLYDKSNENNERPIDILPSKEFDSPEAVLDSASSRDAIWRTVETLDPRETEVINMYYGWGLTMKQIAQRSGVHRKAIDYWLKKAERKLSANLPAVLSGEMPDLIKSA